jgi:hypothetical protein
MTPVLARIGIDMLGGLCGIAILMRARATVDPGVVTGKVGWAAIAFCGALTSASLGVDAEGFMPDVAASILLITTLAVTRGRVEILARPEDRLGQAHGEERAYSSARVWAIAAAGLAAYFGTSFALGSPPW